MSYSTEYQIAFALAECIVQKREVIVLRFSDGTPTFDGKAHGCSEWICPELCDSDEETA